MQPNKANGFLAGGIVSGVITMFFGIIGLVFKIIGVVFVNNPEEVNVTVNGRVLEGAEAAEAAFKTGKALSTVGGVFLIATAVTLVICLTLFAIYAGKRNSMR